MLINFNTIEEKIFLQKDLQKQMPEFENIFSQWQQSVKSPIFKQVRQKTKLQLLEMLNLNHVKILENYYKEPVYIKELNFKISNNIECKTQDLECLLMDYDGFADNIVLTRNNNDIKISFWR